MTIISFPPVPQDISVDENYLRRLVTVLSSMQSGNLNNIGEVTLDTDTSTVVTDTRVGGNSMILFMPITATAATENASGSMYVSSRGRGTFTISHTAGSTDRRFLYAVLG